MSKAYDRLEWDFLECVMQEMGFSHLWIQWIMQYVTSVSYSYLLNGVEQGLVIPERGIRQGDPLSPYLFILCSEVLSGLCSKAQRDGRLPGVRIALGCPRVNHLLFADDTMFFCRSDGQSCSTLLTILKKYENASGQMLNKAKSAITFSSKTSEDTKNEAQRLLGIQKVGGLGKYLGLPEMFGRKKRDLFNQIIDRIRQRSRSYSSKFLSPAGKTTMLKSVLSAMPTYTMSCFKIPKSLCKRIQSALTRFWWDSSEEKKKMTWLAWNKMTKSKRDGGLGFRDITNFNDALLAKVSWRILNRPESLLARLLLGKYCKTESFLTCSASSTASHGWRGICIGRDLLKSQLGKAIGSGTDSSVWYDPWISLTSHATPVGPPPKDCQHLCVNDLICPNSKTWNREKIREILPHHEEVILLLRPSKLNAPDRYLWLPTKSGVYTAKSGYHEASKESNHQTHQDATLRDFNWLKEVWNFRCSPKVKFLLWKVLNNALPTGRTLQERNINPDAVCPHCNDQESSLHLFFHCPLAKQGIEVTNKLTCLPPTGICQGTLSPWILWALWTTRNKKIFEKKSPNGPDIVSTAIHQAREWITAQDLRPQIPKSHQNPSDLITRSDSIRCFSDAAWRTDSREAGLGWIFFDYPLMSETQGTTFLQNVSTPLLAEASALLFAIHEALDLGIKNIIFASIRNS
ncbi:PREDICTED: uncharacterized protein LOC109130642 [Camelina sativa]|uniref:Uncharacterized protein LOC109130642 n=1 Tax=Camelina sativa TaxID=90675 RepID=A0ABM1RAL6_CAMSA|nr:PREDICTED: uncharacterized protein LOC109130642 [Camelina sativa]